MYSRAPLLYSPRATLHLCSRPCCKTPGPADHLLFPPPRLSWYFVCEVPFSTQTQKN